MTILVIDRYLIIALIVSVIEDIFVVENENNIQMVKLL